jgi:Cupin
MLDVLSAVLRELRFESAGYRRLELRAPWAVSFHQQGLRGIHIVVQGRCEIVLGGNSPCLLEAGDLIIAPRADAHVLRSLQTAFVARPIHWLCAYPAMSSKRAM